MNQFIDVSTSRLEVFKANLKLEHPILGVHYLDNISQPYDTHQDTVCTALRRVFKYGKTLVLNSGKCAQLCDGGDYFMKFKEIDDADVIKVYVEDEHVFQDAKVCQKYLSLLPRIPDYLICIDQVGRGRRSSSRGNYVS